MFRLILLRITSGFGEGEDVRHGGGKEASGRNALAHVFYLCSIYPSMRRFGETHPLILDTQMASSIAEWVRRAPRDILLALADSEARDGAASALGKIIVAEMTMDYPEFVESDAPWLPF